MKIKVLLTLAIVSLLAISCSDEYDDSNIRNDIADLANRVQKLEKLCKEMNTNIASLQALMDVLQQNDYITEITLVMENGKEIGYTISFLNHTPITIYHGKDGQNGLNGQNGITPQLKIENDYWYISYDQGNSWQQLDKATADNMNVPQFKIEMGFWYVSYDNGNSWEQLGKATGEDGNDGINATTPKLKIVDGYWYVSYDHGSSWEQLGKATGENGSNGQDATIPQFIIQDGYWCISYDNGRTWQKLGQATGNNGNTPQFKIENDYWYVSYDGISWQLLGKATGDNGNDGASGTTPIFKIVDGYWHVSYDNGNSWQNVGQATGNNGSDGNSPQINVKKDTDNVYYWTLNGSWLLDENGQKIKAQGTDGENGSDGKDGKTPQLKVENEFWYVSYDNGTSWQQLGKATGENSSSIFKKVDYQSNEDYVTFILTNGESFNLPKSKSIDIIFEKTTDIGVFPNTTLKIPYTITGKVDEDAQIEAIGTEGLKAKIIHKSTTEGHVEISIPAEINEYSRVLVFLILKDRTITRAFTFENGVFEIISDERNLTYHRTIFTVAITTNVPYSYKIDEQAQEWLQFYARTRATHNEEIVFAAYENKGKMRSGIITFFNDNDQALKKIIVVQTGKSLSDFYEIKGDTAVVYLNRTTSDNIGRVLEHAYNNLSPSVFAFKGRNLSPVDLSKWDNPIRKLSTYRGGRNLKVLDFSGVKDFDKVPDYAFAALDKAGLNECFTALEKIILPTTIKEIGERAFYKSKAAIEYFADNITSIKKGAFENCVGLTSAKLPNITFLDEDVFKGCTSLVSLEIPNIQTIPKNTFNGCESLKIIDLPTVTAIGEKAFYNCVALTTANVPKLTSIGHQGFARTALTHADFPKVTTIIGEAFRDCENLTYVNMPEITDIQFATFDGCTKLTTVNFPKVKIMISQAFYQCENLTSVNLPEITEIGGSVFGGCTKLTTIDFPKVTAIGKYAFENCTNLTSVKLPKITEIPSRAFYMCTNLSSIDFPQITSIGEYAFRGCSSLTNIDFSWLSTAIGNYAFSECTNLTTVNLPKVQTINEAVFKNCTSLTELNITSPSLKVVNRNFIDANLSPNVRLYLNKNQSENVNGNLWNNLMWKEVICK